MRQKYYKQKQTANADSVNNLMRQCNMQHNISACPILAKEQYMKRHYRVCAQLRFNICQELGVKLGNKHWYDHVPKLVEMSYEGKINQILEPASANHRTIPNDKPDIIIRDSKPGTCMLIDVAIPGDRNVMKKEAEKILKYQDLIMDIHRMWNVKSKEIPVITGVIGTISKSLRQYLINILGKHEIKELQKTAMLGTAHKLRQVLM
jgi:hypothetical protein